MSASARLFVALELSDVAREALASWASEAIASVPGLRPVGSEDLHATLCFLGSRPEVEIDPIAAACGVVAGEPVVESSFGSVLWLPARRPRVLAVSLSDPEGVLGRVQSALSAALVAGGWYVPESRPFLGHVTVARVRRDARVRPAALQPPPTSPVRCQRVTLYRSRLSSSGARYEALASVSLGSAPGAADPMSVVRRFYDLQAQVYGGEAPADSLRDALRDDVVWHVPGASAIAGEHRGVDAVLEYMDTRRRMTGSTFRVTIHGTAMIAGRVVQLAGGSALREGRSVRWETVGVFRVAEGRIAECWLVPFDQAVFDEIWS
ncbi:MAG TPA: RNA 2',3'-cyclic phosphodiesterase [Solirubrobacteraceae bacterium]|nr:RNA 2',3'-cyclic phosphodiesterase [Solirubrobacteraceae bacterium]